MHQIFMRRGLDTACGTAVNLIDLTDVYMTFFVPEAAAGRIALGTGVRPRLDAALFSLALARFGRAARVP